MATGATPPFVPDQQMLQQFMQQVMGNAANPGGGTPPTQTAPNVPPYQVPQPTPPRMQRTDNTPHPVGPGQGGARRAAEMKNFGASISNTVNQLVYAHQQRKAREDQKVFDNFALNYKGLQDAQAQMDEAARAMDEAKKKGDQQGYLDAAKRLQQAQTALKQNRTNLDDIASDPKKRKILAKGFGIDDKNAATPERQQAITAVRKQMGVGQGAGDLLSRLPQTQQLTPQAQGQAMAQQAGVAAKPGTMAQLLNAMNRKTEDEMRRERDAAKLGLQTDEFVKKLSDAGKAPVRDAEGNIARNPDGSMQVRNMTNDEIAADPALYQKKQQIDAKIDLEKAQAKATTSRAWTMALAEQRKQKEAQLARDPATVQAWVKQVTDPTSGTTIANVPAGARSAVIQAVSASGKKLSKPLTSEEIKRMDLSNNAVKNLEEMKAIVARRPDLFGAAGWGHNKFEYAFAGGDPDALRFQATSKLAGLPLVGIHGVRGKWAVEDFDNLTGDFWLKPESMNGVLDEALRSAREFQTLAGRGPQLGGADDSSVIVVTPEDMKNASKPK